MTYVARQIDEIGHDPALRYYGAALAVVSVITAIHWLYRQPLSQILSPGTTPICWPFFESCHLVRFLSPAAIHVLVLLLFLASVINGVQFLTGTTRTAYWLAVLLLFVRSVMLFQDYRLMLNQHYMATWITGAFLFAEALRSAVVAPESPELRNRWPQSEWSSSCPPRRHYRRLP